LQQGAVLLFFLFDCCCARNDTRIRLSPRHHHMTRSQVIGGGWRMPKIQEVLLEWFAQNSDRYDTASACASIVVNVYQLLP
jgi:hypothetical protein